jgi:hypothetical protein
MKVMAVAVDGTAVVQLIRPEGRAGRGSRMPSVATPRRGRGRRGVGAVAAALTSAAVLSGCLAVGGAGAAAPPQDRPADRGGPAATSAQAGADVLSGLEVAPRRDRASYRREAFGSGWGRLNGCEVRDVVLARQLQDAVRTRGSRCEIESGTLADPYTGRRLRYERGGDPGRGLDVDHLVSLRHAWQAGAAAWTRSRREAFANDLRNLQLTAASVNRAKGDAPVDAWVPPNRAYRCTYARRWVAVKAAWRLTVTAVERQSLTRLLRSCPAS